MTKPITGSVARVEDEHTLIINRGSEHHVTEGMVFGVLAEDGDQIIDPETGDVIGELPSVKLRVRVTEVHPRYSRAATFVKYQPPPTKIPSIVPSFLDQNSPASRARINEILGPNFGETIGKSLRESGAFDSINKMIAAEMANPTPVTQQIAGAKKQRPKVEEIRREVTVNIGDKVEQEV